MTALTTKPLKDDLPFGVRISGVNRESVKDEAVRKQILDLYEERGLVVFEGMEQSTEMQLELSEVFGPLEAHPLAAANKHVDGANLPGVIVIDSKPEEAGIIEIEGEEIAGWTPWHFDSSYTKKLCRGAVLRAITIAPEGGRTGFGDGIQLYNDFPPRLRDKLEGKEIIYHPHLMITNLRFGMPKNWRYVKLGHNSQKMLDISVDKTAAAHPAIWTRKTGEKVLHLSSQCAAGIVGMDPAEGEALLEEALQEIYAVMTPYWHTWSPTDMVVWDNWRFIHQGGGMPIQYARRLDRTTIAGDYGLGRFIDEPVSERAPEFAL
jgi:taurine dioxygenase